MTLALGVDIGGSGIKAALVDTDKGELATERRRVETPASLEPDDVLDAVVQMVAGFDGDAPVGVGFPAVVVDGVPRTGFTAHEVQSWIGAPVAQQLSERIGRPVTLINDADAAGIAEVRLGAGRGVRGMVLLLTLGTGIGSALFMNGRLVPNTELGKLRLPGRKGPAEGFAAAGVRDEEGLKWAEYAERLDEYLDHVVLLLRPDLILLGGGISKKADKWLPRISVEVPVKAAELRNAAGIIGAALAAAE